MANAKERGNLRQTLLSIQEELVQTRAELQNWTDKGFELNNPPENTNKENESVRQPTNGKSRTNLEQEQISKLLQNLSKLSQTIVDDALADEQAMNSFASWKFVFDSFYIWSSKLEYLDLDGMYIKLDLNPREDFILL